MFEAISTNDKFTTNSPVGQNAKVVFIFGSILLAIITLVYVFYANNFLMSMRKHDYGLFMMLGAKSGVISKLIILETIVIGLVSTLVGIVFGIGVTQILSDFLAMRCIFHSPISRRFICRLFGQRLSCFWCCSSLPGS